MTTQTEVLPHETVWTITNAAVSARALHLVADLGVADRMENATVTVDDLARRCGANADALDRVLSLLVLNGVFVRTPQGYSHNDASRLLRSDHPTSMRAFARMMGLPIFWSSFGALEDSLRTGTPSLQSVHAEGLWAYLRDHPDEAQIFNDAMQAKATADLAAVLGSYDFRPFATVADIGGGQGHLLRAVVDAVPTVHGVLFDLPGVIESLPPVPPRLTLHQGDFFVDPLPRADAYVLMEVIHDWPDREATQILRAIRRAANPGATVLIVEGVLPEDEPDPRAHTLDVIMLAITGGRERTARQLETLLRAADMRLTNVIQTHGPMRIVEAIAT